MGNLRSSEKKQKHYIRRDANFTKQPYSASLSKGTQTDSGVNPVRPTLFPISPVHAEFIVISQKGDNAALGKRNSSLGMCFSRFTMWALNNPMELLCGLPTEPNG